MSDDLISDIDVGSQRGIPEPADPVWAGICARLSDEFPGLQVRQVVSEVRRAREATQLFGLDADEQARSAETMARNNLTLLAGGADLARLDPERHVREPR
jgi:hypothetical protein